MAGSLGYTPAIPPTTALHNTDVNSLSSQYATDYSHQSTALIQRIVKNIIYDTAPKQFLDLKLLNMMPRENSPSDEFFYHEMGYGRDPIPVVTGSTPAGAVDAPKTITSNAAGVAIASVDMIVNLPTGEKATITNINTGTSVITLTPMSGQNIPVIADASVLSVHSPVEADGVDYISNYFRQTTTERFNYVQMLVKATRFGRMELYKYNNAGSTQNYIPMQKTKCLTQFRVDLSNIFWNGEKGEVVLANGMKAKTAQGIYPAMVGAGSPNANPTPANLPGAFETLVLDTEFNAYGETRFLYGSNRYILELSKQYKDSLTRYKPNDMVAQLNLNAVDIGSSRIVFVPMKRFEDTASFPADWSKKLILVDHDSITPMECWGEEMGETLPRRNGGTRENFQDFWISGTFSTRFVNPLGCGWLDVNA